ncbi:MAG: SCP2 sterol-binding domain-containing protein [Saprospiraceae bacterium]|nr:SCP2 sterol-binding domain-containing protein [Saprospiraceae bacterium]MCB9323475.1 SCP2 sterol-binding domain-containing protein [Lewinellaceae bacterium]
MNISEVTEMIRAQAQKNAPFGATLKFQIDGEFIFLDGNGPENIISNEDKEADCMISTTSEHFQKLFKGELNPMMAVMTGKVKVKGDMGVAMKLKSLMEG